MNQSTSDLLKELAKKYIWWKKPAEAMEYPERVIIQIMNIGAYEDVQSLVKIVNTNDLQQILKNAEIGQFNEKSWYYWHYRLGLATLDYVPPLPQSRYK